MVTQLSQRSRAAERNTAAEESSGEKPGGTAPEVEGAMHLSFSTAGALKARLRSVKSGLSLVKPASSGVWRGFEPPLHGSKERFLG